MKTVYIIEDDPDISELLHIIVSNEGCKAFTFSEIDEAEIKIGKEIPNLIITDLSVSGENASKLMKKLKKDRFLSEIPVLLVSAQNSLKEIAKELKVDGYLEKPFNVKDLVAAIKKLVN